MVVGGPRFELRGGSWNVTGLKLHPVKHKEGFISVSKSLNLHHHHNTVQSSHTFVGLLGVALRRDHNLSGFL